MARHDDALFNGHEPPHAADVFQKCHDSLARAIGAGEVGALGTTDPIRSPWIVFVPILQVFG